MNRFSPRPRLNCFSPQPRLNCFSPQPRLNRFSPRPRLNGSTDRPGLDGSARPKASALRLLAVLGTVMLGLAGCDKDKSSTDPESGANLLGSSVSGDGDSLGGGGDEDELYGESTLADDGEELTIAPRPELPKPAKPVQQCKTVKEGKKKVRQCADVDPKPKISAAHGVYALLGDFRWGQTPIQVFKLLSREIEEEYTKRQEAATKDPTEQDANRRWRAEQLQALKANHTKFTAGSKHRWGVSLIQYEYEDDAEEEMLWVRTAQGLRKFYFFKNGELWKVFYAYSTDVWPGKAYADVVEEKFKKWFGPSPDEKVTQDPVTAAPLLRYFEWEAQDGEKVRSFDLTQVHGVIGLAVVDGNVERAIGQRLPNMPQKREYENVVNDVLGESDVCYDANGDILECGKKPAIE